jgi:cytidylate kinase
MLSRQRECRALGVIVMEGRDIGTVIFPDAKYKFFITASPEERARRRFLQKGEVADGATLATVAAEIAERDRIDSTRATAPLKPAAGALVLKTDGMDQEAVVEALLAHMAEEDRP